jgi:hypothetical protein
VKKNKHECIQLMEPIHQVLYAIIDLHIKSETPGSLPPTTLHHIGEFTEQASMHLDLIHVTDGISRTIHKIHVFVEEQQDGSWIKKLLRQSEISTLLKDCHAGVQQAVEVFKVGVTRIIQVPHT